MFERGGVRSPSIVAIAPAMRLVNHQTRKIAGVYRKHCRTFSGDSAFPLSGVILTVFLIAAHWALQQSPPARRERALRRRQIKGWLTRGLLLTQFPCHAYKAKSFAVVFRHR
jgi:hypothetical protein